MSVESTNIAYAYTMGIMPQTVGAGLSNRPPFSDRTIEINHIMIANILESPLKMPLADLRYTDIPAIRCGRTVNNYFADRSHSSCESFLTPNRSSI